MRQFIPSRLSFQKMVCIAFLSSACITRAQNIDENKVRMSFIQLPTHVIAKKYTVYDVVVVRAYETANEDSLALYQARLESASAVYEAELAAWQQNVKNLKRTHLVQMANWEKQNNAGTPSSPPKEPEYPVQPVIQNVELPQLHTDITDQEIDNRIDLKGYSRGGGGAMLTVEIQPISNIQIVESKKGTGEAMRYNYTCNYTLPLGIKVEVPGQGVVFQTIVGNSQSTYTMKSFDSKYEYQLWMMDNKDQFWLDLEKNARNKALNVLNETVNNKCGFPVKSRVAEVYSVKRFKDYSYEDVTTAYTIASQGYKKIADSRDRSAAKAKLNEAVGLWKNILEESNLTDNKSRINDKVTAMLQCNIAQAYIWLGQFDDAEIYINLAKNSGVSKFKRIAEDLEALLKERRLRWNAYFG